MKKMPDYLKLIWDADKEAPEPRSLEGLLYFLEKGFFVIMGTLLLSATIIVWKYFF